MGRKSQEMNESDSRLNPEDALALFYSKDISLLSCRANEKRFSLNPRREVTYIVDRNINYTNICKSGCKFCAYFRKKGKQGAELLSHEAISLKIGQTIELAANRFYFREVYILISK